MFPRQKITGVTGNRIKMDASPPVVAGYTSKRSYQEQTKVQAAIAGNMGMSGGANSLSVNSFWNSQYQYYFTGLIPAEPSYSQSNQLALFYRDIYLNDNVAGAVVDLQSTFPFSDFDLRGLEESKLAIFEDAMSQLNIQQMLPVISTAYLVDGFFCGSLIFDPKSKRFIDTLVHDALQCNVIPGPFFNMMPQINVQTSAATINLLNSDSEYAREYIDSLPPSFINLISQGQYTLDPVTTLYVARKSLTDRAYISYLHRILPMYLIEKTMFRGTLVEASRRQRATTHITAGDDIWTPTGEELAALVAQFQQAEYDPLGGWVSTRNAVQINDIRPGGDFWKWTDMSDIMTPYKLRALGTSESFLSGETSYAAMESAYSLFLESQNTYRNRLTNAIFTSTLFPLIAVSNGMYKKGTTEAEKLKGNRISKFLMNAKHKATLDIPQLMWHKSLEARGEENTFDLLEQVSEKGVPIPLKQWMAAAGLDKDSLLKDLKEDGDLRKKLEQYTGKDTSHEGEEEVGDAYASHRPTAQSTKNRVIGKKALLSRDFGDPQDYTFSKTGKKQYQHGSRMKTRELHAVIAKIAARAERDPQYRYQLAKANVERLGYNTMPLGGDLKGQ